MTMATIGLYSIMKYTDGIPHAAVAFFSVQCVEILELRIAPEFLCATKQARVLLASAEDMAAKCYLALAAVWPRDHAGRAWRAL